MFSSVCVCRHYKQVNRQVDHDRTHYLNYISLVSSSSLKHDSAAQTQTQGGQPPSHPGFTCFESQEK